MKIFIFFRMLIFELKMMLLTALFCFLHTLQYQHTLFIFTFVVENNSLTHNFLTTKIKIYEKLF